MKNKLINLIDFKKVDILLEGFNKTTGFVTAILDLEGNILSKSGWRKICTEFHRVHPETAKKCTISDTVLAGKMAEGEKYHFYKCLNGLVDVAVPIFLRGEHIANLFSGQFFFEKPDNNYFIKQASTYNFNEKTYLDALQNVPVVSKEKVKIAMNFLLEMTDLIVEMTIQRLEQEELNIALQESEEKYRLLHEASGVGIGYYTPDGIVISYNKIAAQNMNGKPDDFIGKSFFELFPKPAAEFYMDRIRKAVQDSSSQEYEDEVPLPGGVHWFKSIYTKIQDKNDKVAGIQIISTDITERKQLEAEILQKNLNLTSLLDISQKLSLTLDLKVVLQKIILSAIELINLNTGAIYLVNNDNLYLGATIPEIPADFPDVFRHSTLKEHPKLLQAVSSKKLVVIPDMTKAKLSKAEQEICESRKMRTLIYLPLIIEKRVLGVLLLATQHTPRTFTEEEINIYRTMSGQAALAIYNSQLYEEIYKLNTELENTIKERTSELTRKTYELTQSQDALLNIVEDLNEKSELVEISRQKLKEKNKELETFTYSVSHDLKAPLRGIDGYGKLLQEMYADKIDDEGKQFIKTIREGTKQMHQLIEDLLTFSRLERATLKFSPVNLQKAINSVLHIFKNEIKERKIVVNNNVPEIELIADNNSLSIVIQNIIENAIKFTKEVKIPEININLQENKNTLTLCISDNGIGFDMTYKNRIFEIFQRLNLPEQYPGTGIGLALVQKSMERQGGKAWAESKLNKGSTFYLEFHKKQMP